jgi:hypothetical protein
MRSRAEIERTGIFKGYASVIVAFRRMTAMGLANFPDVEACFNGYMTLTRDDAAENALFNAERDELVAKFTAGLEAENQADEEAEEKAKAAAKTQRTRPEPKAEPPYKEPQGKIARVKDHAGITEMLAGMAAEGNTYAQWLMDVAAPELPCPHCGKSSVSHLFTIIETYDLAEEAGDFT